MVKLGISISFMNGIEFFLKDKMVVEDLMLVSTMVFTFALLSPVIQNLPHFPPQPPTFDEDDDETPWNIAQQEPNHDLFRSRGNQSNPIKFKLEMASFDGYMHIKDFLDWLDNVEDYFECIG